MIFRFILNKIPIYLICMLYLFYMQFTHIVYNVYIYYLRTTTSSMDASARDVGSPVSGSGTSFSATHVYTPSSTNLPMPLRNR